MLSGFWETLGIPLLATGLVACIGSAAPERPVTAEPTSTPSASVAPVNTTVLPTPSLEVLRSPEPQPIEPLVTGAVIRFDSWSPDGSIFAYWYAGELDETSGWYPGPPGALHFYDRASGRSCVKPDIVSEEYGQQLQWKADGTVIAIHEQGASQGIPCGEFSPVDVERPDPFPNFVLSPGGGFRAETTITPADTACSYYDALTTITALDSGAVVNSYQWKSPCGEGVIAAGGKWLGADLFLIYYTVDKGPILLTVQGEAIHVTLEIFGFEIGTGSAPVESSAYSAFGDESGFYHLILDAWIPGTGSLPSRLYHSESGEIEEFPPTLHGPAQFSPDGQWLMLAQFDQERGFQEGWWLRRVDPPGSALQFIPGMFDNWVLWSPDVTRIGLGLTVNGEDGSVGDSQENGRREYFVVVLLLADAQTTRRWRTGPYHTFPYGWSPDGRWIVAVGNRPGFNSYALYLLEP